MNVLVKFPTRGRSARFLGAFKKYVAFAKSFRQMQFVITIDDDDAGMHDRALVSFLESFPNVRVCSGRPEGKISAVNRDIDKLLPWDILVLASDDMIPHVLGYDEIIRKRMAEHYPDTDGVLFFNDGYQGSRLNTLCILGRKYYERFGYIYYPGYRSTWCDREFMEVAYRLGRQTYFDDVIIRHEHPDWGHGEADEIHEANHANLSHDRALYEARKALNFELDRQ